MKINLLPSKKTPQPQFSPDSFASLYNGNNKKLAYLADHLVAILAFLIPTSILLVFMNMLGFAPFGDKCLFVSDGISKNLPMLSVLQEYIQNGTFSFLSLATASVDEYFFIFLYYLASPMRLLLLFAPAELSVVLLQLYCVLLAGIGSLCMHYCLTHRHSGHCYSRYDFFVLLFTSAYGMSSYFLTQYNDFMYLECVALFPLLFHAYERMMTQKKPRMFLLLGTSCMICQFYLTTIVLLIFLFYTLLSDNESFSDRLAYIMHYCKNSILLFLTGGITAIPGLYILYRNRVVTSSCPDFSLATGFFSFFSRFLPLNYASPVTTESSGNNLYCGLFVLIFILLFFFDKNRSLGQKLRAVLMLALLFGCVNIVPVRYFMFLCSENNSVYNPLGFLLIFFLLLLCAEGFYNTKKIPSFLYYAAIAVPCILYFVACNYAKDYSRTSSMFTTLVFLVLYFLYFLFMKKDSIRQESFYGILLLTTLLELSMNTFIQLQDVSLVAVTTEKSIRHYDNPAEQNAESPFSIDFDEDFSLPYGYLASTYTEDSISEKGTEFDRQNALADFLGAKTALFTPVEIAIDCTTPNEDITCKQYDNNILTISVKKDTPSAKQEKNELTLHITSEESGDLYLYTDAICHIGEVKAGESIDHTLSFQTASNVATNYWIHAAILNPAALEEIRQSASDVSYERIHTTLFSETVKINANHAGSFIYSLPSSPFLKVTVDGKPTVAVESPSGSVLIPITAGEHLVQYHLVFMPIIVGCVLFTLTWIVLFLFSRKRKQALPYHAKTDITMAICGFCKRNAMAIYSFFIPFCILLIACILSSCSPFGNNTFFDRDGSILTLAMFRQRKYQLEAGNIFYSWLCGSGSNIFNSMPNTFLSLWLLLVPYDQLLNVMTILELIKIALCGTSMYFYLTRNLNSVRVHPKDYRVLVFTSAYSLCAYMLNMHSYFLWTNVLILFPLILLAMDYLMIQKKPALYIVLLAISILADYNLSLFICIFLVMWFFTYPCRGIREFIRTGLRFALSSLLAAAMGFIGFYPILANLQISPYSTFDSAWPTLGFFQSYWDSVKQVFLFSDPVIVCTENGAINLYCGVFCILLLVISLFLSHKKKGQFVKLFMIAFIFISSNNDLLSYLWNGLHYQIKVPNRYSFLLVFLIVESACNAFIRLRKVSAKRSALWLSCIAVILFGSIFFAERTLSNEAIIATLIFAFVFLALMILIIRRPAKKSMYYKIFVCCALLELLLHVCYNFRTIYVGADLSNHLSSVSDYVREEYLDDTEKIGVASILTSNVGMQLGTPSFLQFNSYVTKYQYQMGLCYGSIASTNNIESKNNFTPFGNAVSNTKYMILDRFMYSAYGDLDGYSPIATCDNFIILENRRTLSPAFYMPEETKNLVKDSTTSDAFINTFCDAYTDHGHQYTDQLMLLEADEDNITENDNNYLTLHRDEDATNEAVDDGTGYYQIIHFTAPRDGVYYYRADEYNYLGELKGGETYEFKIDSESEYGYVTRYDDAIFQAFYDSASKHTFTTTNWDSSSLEGNITLPEDGYIHFNIPYEPGWTAYVDGVEAETSTFFDGAIYIPATQGTHTIRLSFFPKALVPSVLVTGLFWFIYLLFFHLKPFFLRGNKTETGAVD